MLDAMKRAFPILVILILVLAGCSTTKSEAGKKPANQKPGFGPETVLVTYRVMPGREAEFEQVLAQAWTIYRNEHLVRAWPHVILRDKEGGDRTAFIEIFTWVDHDAPDHPPKSVRDIWARMNELCEARFGHNGIEGGEVQLVQSTQ